jgi:hypothetical protein
MKLINLFGKLMEINDDRWVHAKMDGQIGNRLRNKQVYG